MATHVCSITQSCPTVCSTMGCSPLDSSAHGVFQTIILEWVAISFSMGSSWPRDWTHVSALADVFFTTQPTGKPIKVAKGDLKTSKPWWYICWWVSGEMDSVILLCWESGTVPDRWISKIHVHLSFDSTISRLEIFPKDTPLKYKNA